MTAAPVPPPRWGPQRARATAGAGVPAPSSGPGRQWAHNTSLVNRLRMPTCVHWGRAWSGRGTRQRWAAWAGIWARQCPSPEVGLEETLRAALRHTAWPLWTGTLAVPSEPTHWAPRWAWAWEDSPASGHVPGMLLATGDPPHHPGPPTHPGEGSPPGLSRLRFCVQYPWPRLARGERRGPHFTLS